MANIPTPRHGILIVTLPGQGATGTLFSHYFDPKAKHGKVRDALAHWFNLWGVSVGHSANFATELEKNTAEVVWCDDVPAHLHGPQTVRFYAQCGERVLQSIETQSPSVIIVLSAYLYEAMASDFMSEKVTTLIGKALGPARRITNMRLKALEQKFEKAHMLVLPTPSKNTTDAFVTTLTAPIRDALTAAGFSLDESPETLTDMAKSLLVVDEKTTLQTWENRLRIDSERARSLWNTLVKEGVISTPDERGRYFVKKKS